MPRPSRRDHLIETAIGLFRQHGYHGTGIDKILDTAGMSKKTMYRYFRSKEELIYAALRQYDGVYRNNFMKDVEAAGYTPREKLLAVFDVAEKWFCSDKFFGCVFINVLGEYSDNTQIREICRQFKQQMWDFIAKLAKETGAEDYKALADEIFLLLEGATVMAQVRGDPDAAKLAKRMAETFISARIC